jgi:hypothetical protein
MNPSKHTLPLWLLLLALAALAGCSPAPGDREEMTAGELAALPTDCEALLARGAAVLAVGLVEASDRAVVDTSHGRCTAAAKDVLTRLRKHETEGVASKVAGHVREHGDPSPHPGVSTRGSDPNPHPDVPDDAAPNTNGSEQTGGEDEADPNPHPDRGDNASEGEDDELVVIIIIWVFVDEDEPALGATDSAPDAPPGSTTPPDDGATQVSESA